MCRLKRDYQCVCTGALKTPYLKLLVAQHWLLVHKTVVEPLSLERNQELPARILESMGDESLTPLPHLPSR